MKGIICTCWRLCDYLMRRGSIAGAKAYVTTCDARFAEGC